MVDAEPNRVMIRCRLANIVERGGFWGAANGYPPGHRPERRRKTNPFGTVDLLSAGPFIRRAAAARWPLRERRGSLAEGRSVEAGSAVTS